ncbi:MAG: hypothetical protein M1814_003696 [Vezdaea aestivalis]|nr:MAG: hypothetical protein M1814_003696 [Vezdaea aestivalis]
MSNTDYYSDRYEPPRRSRRHRANYDDYGYADDNYPSGRQAAGQSALIPRTRQDSDTSYVEDIRRDFPPPGGAYSSTGRSSRPSYARRASSLDGYDGKYAPSTNGSTRGRDRDGGRTDRGRSKSRVDRWRDDLEHPKETLSKHRNELGGAALGAVLAAGGKELYDRYDAKEHPRRQRSSSRRRLAQAGLGVAGALVGAGAAKKIAERNHREVEEDERAYGSDGRPRKSRRKSVGDFGTKAAGTAAGLIGPMLAAQGGSGGRGGYPQYGGQQYGSSRGRKDGYDDRRDRNRSYGSSRSRDHSPGEKSEKIQQAMKAALTAAAAEGWRSRDEPGGALSGEKLRRIVTAAVSAAGVDALVDKHPDDHSTRNTIVSALAGLLGNRVINGSRDADFGTTDGGRGRSRDGRYDSRSRSRGGGRSDSRGGPGLGSLAGLGAAAAAGKALWDKSRSHSRKRDDGHRGRRAYSSDGSRSPPRHRSRSVSRYLDKGLSKLGLKEDKGQDKIRHDDRRGYSDDEGYGRSRGLRGGAAAGAAAGSSKRSSSSSSDSSMDSDTERKERRKRRGKEYLTAGLASVATVNAAHELYEGYEKNQKRMKEVRQGTLEPEEAAKMKRMGYAKDAFAVGLAVLGVKGAVDNWKETRASKHEADEFCRRREEHRRRRAEAGEKGGQRRRSKSVDYADSYYPAPIYDDQPGYGAPPPPTGPIYSDGNPYATTGAVAPEPPFNTGGRGYDDRRY